MFMTQRPRPHLSQGFPCPVCGTATSSVGWLTICKHHGDVSAFGDERSVDDTGALAEGRTEALRRVEQALLRRFGHRASLGLRQPLHGWYRDRGEASDPCAPYVARATTLELYLDREPEDLEVAAVAADAYWGALSVMSRTHSPWPFMRRALAHVATIARLNPADADALDVLQRVSAHAIEHRLAPPSELAELCLLVADVFDAHTEARPEDAEVALQAVVWARRSLSVDPDTERATLLLRADRLLASMERATTIAYRMQDTFAHEVCRACRLSTKLCFAEAPRGQARWIERHIAVLEQCWSEVDRAKGVAVGLAHLYMQRAQVAGTRRAREAWWHRGLRLATRRGSAVLEHFAPFLLALVDGTTKLAAQSSCERERSRWNELVDRLARRLPFPERDRPMAVFFAAALCERVVEHSCSVRASDAARWCAWWLAFAGAATEWDECTYEPMRARAEETLGSLCSS